MRKHTGHMTNIEDGDGEKRTRRLDELSVWCLANSIIIFRHYKQKQLFVEEPSGRTRHFSYQTHASYHNAGLANEEPTGGSTGHSTK